MVDHSGKPIEEPALPQQHVAPARVAGRPQQPVVARVLVLEHVAVAADDQPLEAGARLGVCRLPGLPAGRRGQQILERAASGSGTGGFGHLGQQRRRPPPAAPHLVARDPIVVDLHHVGLVDGVGDAALLPAQA